MTGCDPSAVDGRPEWFRNVGESDLQGSGQPGGGLVAELADRAAVLGRVLLVADGGGGRGAGQRQHQREDPSVPTWATSCRPRMHGLSPGHQAVDATRESPKAARAGADGTPHVNGVRRCPDRRAGHPYCGRCASLIARNSLVSLHAGHTSPAASCAPMWYRNVRSSSAPDRSQSGFTSSDTLW